MGLEDATMGGKVDPNKTTFTAADELSTSKSHRKDGSKDDMTSESNNISRQPQELSYLDEGK